MSRSIDDEYLRGNRNFSGAQETAGSHLGDLAVAGEDLAVDDRGSVALGPLFQAGSPAGKIVHDLRH